MSGPTRPLVSPSWATDTLFSAGPVAGNVNKNAPDTGMVQEGFDPTDPLAAEHANYLWNANGVWKDHLDDAILGHGFWMHDDFIGVDVGSPVLPDAALWATTGDVDVIDDSANDGFGCLQMTSSSGSHTAVVRTGAVFPIGTRDFYYSARMRLSTYTNGTLFFGLYDDGGSADCFMIEAGAANWNALYGAGGASSHDLGVAGGASAYKRFEVYRIGGFLNYTIDGNLVYQVANTSNLNPMRFYMKTNYVSTTLNFVCDSVKLWIQRP